MNKRSSISRKSIQEEETKDELDLIRNKFNFSKDFPDIFDETNSKYIEENFIINNIHKGYWKIY